MQLKIKGKKWNIILDKSVNRSFTDFSKLEIRIKTEFDLIHEMLHVILHDDLMAKEWDKEMEEYVVSILSRSLEIFVLENLDKISQVVDLSKIEDFSMTSLDH